MEQLIKHIDKTIERVLVFIFGLLIIDVIWQVFSRYVLGQSFSFTEEFARYALIWLAVLGAAYLNGQREHLAMDYFLQKLPEDKKVKRFKAIEGLMMLFALIVMVVGGGNLAYTSFELGQRSAAMNISLGWIYLIVPISGLLIILYSVHNIKRL